MSVECFYGEKSLSVIDKDKLIQRIPYVGGYIQFREAFGNDDIDKLDMKLFNLDINISMWIFFLEYAKHGVIQSCTDSDGSERAFVLNDQNILKVTRHADFMVMGEFIYMITLLILQSGNNDFEYDNLFRCTDSAETCLNLQYFAFLVDSFDNVHDDLIDAVACILASRRVWKYADEIGNEWNEKHINRFVKRKKSFFGMERNVFYTVLTWCVESKCDNAQKLELLLQLAVDYADTKKQIDTEIARVLKKHFTTITTPLPGDTVVWLCESSGHGVEYKIRRSFLCRKIVDEMIDRQIVKMKKRRPVETKQLKRCEVVLDGNMLRTMDSFTRRKKDYLLYDTPGLTVMHELFGRNYSYDLLFSDDGKWLYLFAVESNEIHGQYDLIFKKLNLRKVLDATYTCARGWEFVSNIRIDQYISPPMVQVKKVETVIFVSLGSGHLYVFHENGHWIMCEPLHGIRMDLVFKQHTHSAVTMTGVETGLKSFCMGRTDPSTLTLFVVGTEPKPCMYRRRIEMLTWANSLRNADNVPWKTPLEDYQSIPYPDIDVSDRTELPALFYLSKLGLVCISGINRNHNLHKTNVTSIHVELDCFIWNGQSVWEKRQLTSEHIAFDRTRLCEKTVCSGSTRPLNGYVLNEKCQIVLISGNRRCDYLNELFKCHVIIIDLQDNTITIKAKHRRCFGWQCTDGFIHGTGYETLKYDHVH